MAFSSTIQPATQTDHPSGTGLEAGTSLLAALVLGFYAVKKSRRELNKLKRKALWIFFKTRAASLFKNKSSAKTLTSKNLLLIIFVAAALILLLTVSWPVALAVLLAGL